MSDISVNHKTVEMSHTKTDKSGHKDENEKLTLDEIFKLVDLYFNNKFVMYSHMKSSYDKFIEEYIPSFLKSNGNIFSEKITKDQNIVYSFEFENIVLKPPTFGSDEKFMFPSDARDRSLTYSAKLLAKVTQIQEIRDIYTKKVLSRKVIGEPDNNVPIAILPVMIKSKYCSLNLKKNFDVTECDYDPGCYFIVNGAEKVVISQEKICENKPLVFLRKDSSTQIHVAQVNSLSPTINGFMQVMMIYLKNDGSITLRAPILSEFPIIILFRALGIESDRSIMDYLVYDKNDDDMIDAVIKAIRLAVDDDGKQIKTQNEAINYLSNKIRVIRKYSETDKKVRQEQKRLHLEFLLENNFLPHITGGRNAKVYFLGYMINRLLNCALGRVPIDDRDSYLNKRVDLVGNLLDKLFRQFFKKMLNECYKYFKKHNTSDEEPINIINQIRPNTIEQGINAALRTGTWGDKKGVAQVLQRLTYLQAIEFFRRIDSPSNDASSSKLTHPRHLHGTQNANLCCVVGDTEVLMSDGITTKKIRDMKNSDRVLTINPETLREEISEIHDFFKRQHEEIIEISTDTGHSLKCTNDHKILISNVNGNIWRRADQLTIGDKIIIKNVQKMVSGEPPVDVSIKRNNVDRKYVTELLENGLINKCIEQSKLEITARLFGSCITDGHIGIRDGCGYLDCSFCVGEENDVFAIVNDIVSLGFSSPHIGRSMTTHINRKNGKKTTYNTYVVSKNGAFAHYMMLMGCFAGRKTDTIRKLPKWITNGNLRIKREFLSGFQGGDGCRLGIWNDTTSKIRLPPTTQTTTNLYKNDTIDYMQTIVDIFREFEISSKVDCKKCDDKFKVYIRFDQSLENIEKYCRVIGYRYCYEKSRKSSPIIGILEYKCNIRKEKQQVYRNIIEYYKNGIKPSKIQKLVNVSYLIIKRVIDCHNHGYVPSAKCTTNIMYDDYLEQNYLGNDKTMSAITSIRKVDDEDVYDFTTSSTNHSFIANGIVVHNCVETPEHSKVGLVKHLTLIGSITVPVQSQIQLLREIVLKKVKKLDDVFPSQMLKYTKIFLNGDWIGLTDEPIELYNHIKELKYNGSVEYTTSVIFDDDTNELRIYCDGGRLFRPVIRVKDNELMLTKSHIKLISLDKIKSDVMITSWNSFMQRNPGIIEYIDSEEQVYAMISPDTDTLYNMKQKEITSSKLAEVKDVDKTNRYGEKTFIKYSHCEIHPSLLLGVIAANIPFLNHNQGPRNIFQYAQGRQAMCIYASNYRYRMDTSFILYHPQKPLINTRTGKYMYNDILSPGENAIVAIACYTGLNQEDSIVFNRSAIERGLFRSTSFNKYISIIQKNRSTAQDDKFMKPDPTKVTGMRHGSYDKLNEKGFIPEETTVVNGDFLIGKVSPIQKTQNSNQEYKDSSESYKQHVSGVVDKVFTDIRNAEGYEMIKMRVRSERIPTIGDKLCSRHG